MLERQQRSLTSLELRPPGNGESHLIVMLHGYGSNEKDLIQLAPELLPECSYTSPRAPLQLDHEMYGWFPIGFTPTGISVDPDAVKEALKKCVTYLEEVIFSFRPPEGKVFLLGFSQGAIMSYMTALTRPDLLHGVIALSGQLPESAMPAIASPELLKTIPFLVLHGIYDDILPIEKGREAKLWLEQHTNDLTYHEYPVAHQISGEGVTAIRSWLVNHSPR
ncbi:MAG: phospholipase [Chlorobium sp.]|nr:phospholipase [Chlorobium phaeovibrioides]NQU45709.1 phospholipase [Chlorobium sp.]